MVQRFQGIQRNGGGALPPEDGRRQQWDRAQTIHGGTLSCTAPKNLDVPTLCLQLKKMKEKKGLYPDKSIYTQQIGPGLCFGALALMLRFFFEVPGLWGRGTSLLSLAGRIAGCLLGGPKL